jgi:NTE family protein
MARLHQWAEAREVRGFVLSYLGQRDERLPYTPAGLIRREAVINYPTNFSAMAEGDLVRLTDRGDQLTRLLLDYYCPVL